MYAFLDYFFLIFHGSLVLFVVIGWTWQRTRRLHLLVMVLIFLSWFGLGLFYGIGYCPSTDWHWRVKRARGETELPSSYVTYYLDQLTRKRWDHVLADRLIMIVGLSALTASIVLNWKDRHHRSRN